MMNIVVEAEINKDGQLVDYQLPPNTPVGRVKLVIQSVDDNEHSEDQPMTERERLRAVLLAAGKLVVADFAPADAVRSSPEESERLAQLFSSDSLTSLDIINEDRGPKG